MEKVSPITDGSSLPKAEAGWRDMLSRPALKASAAAMCLLCLLVLAQAEFHFVSGLLLHWSGEAGTEGEVRVQQEDLRVVEGMNVDDRTQIVAEGDGAQQRNSAIPFAELPLEKSGGFTLAGVTAASTAAAFKCLTQAVYYEAASEPLKGRRAVAQVVLNRVRHPAYPNSICGVVYQGAARTTGCQFSFTCDGSLLRPPSSVLWREAEAVVRQALSGSVETSVGTATHYHADYVLPKWAFRLGKIRQLGRHIFYRFKGTWGRSSAFASRYSGVELIPALNFSTLRERLLAKDAGMFERQIAPGLTVPPHVTDRHAENDVGGRLDVTKEWRLSIPDPVQASSRYLAIAAPSSDESTTSPPTDLAVAKKAATVAMQ